MITKRVGFEASYVSTATEQSEVFLIIQNFSERQQYILSEADFIAQQNNNHTRRAYLADLARWNSFLAGREPSLALVIEWRDLLVTQLSSATAMRVFSTVRSYYRWSGGPAYFNQVKSPKRIKNWSPETPSEANINAALKICTIDKDRAVMVLLNNGLRAQEVCDLSDEDYTFEPLYDAWILRVIGKGNKMRMVPATKETVEALERRPAVGGKMFPGLNPRKVYYVVDKWSRRAGVAGLHPHGFRHAYATRLTRAKVGLVQLQQLLGHARSDTTSIYISLDLGDLVSASRLDPRNV